MHLLVVTMQLTGIGLILTAVDVFAVPWLRDALSPSPPTAVTDLSDHVVICGYTPRGEAFVSELDSRDQPYVIVEPDRETAVDLHSREYRVVHGDPESVATLEAAAIADARVLVADAADDTNASIALSAAEAAPDVRRLSFVEDSDLAEYHRIAGADEVFSPRQLLGRSLAGQVPTAVTTDAEEGIEIGDDFELAELPVQSGSELAGTTFAEASIRHRTGANVVGAWFGPEFRSPIGQDDRLDADTTLLVAGQPGELDALRELTASELRTLSTRRVVVAGAGDAGAAARDALSVPGIEVTVLDIDPAREPDVVGDARDPDVLAEAGIGDASSVVFTLSDDTTATFATLIARDTNPDLRIAVRANEEENTRKLYRAGADYVQSLARVSGRMLVSTVFKDQEVLAYDRRVELVKVPADALAGETLTSARVRERTGCTVLGVERDGETLTDLDPDSLRFRPEDTVLLAGIDEAVNRFEATFGD
jgi:Trk K+ transport system NAD-binding subunit